MIALSPDPSFYHDMVILEGSTIPRLLAFLGRLKDRKIGRELSASYIYNPFLFYSIRRRMTKRKNIYEKILSRSLFEDVWEVELTDIEEIYILSSILKEIDI